MKEYLKVGQLQWILFLIAIFVSWEFWLIWVFSLFLSDNDED